MNLAIVLTLKVNNARIFIHLIKSFRTIIIVFIIFNANMCMQFTLIFLKNINIVSEQNVSSV